MPLVTERTLNNQLTMAHCEIKLSGQNAPEQMMHDLIMVRVEQSLYLPSMFVIKLHNRNLQWFDSNLIEIGKEVTILMSQDTTVQALLIGEITALELDAAPRGVPTITIRGYDRLHRLQRGRHSRSFVQVSISDLVSSIAREAGLSAQATSTSEVYEYIYQNNETNFDFLQRWANRIGMELVAEGHFLKLRERATGQQTASLEWGMNLAHFTGRLTTSQQVDEVMVRGWDAKKKQAIVGKASSSTNRPNIGEGRSGAQFANRAFGDAKIASVYRPVNSQAEADKIAKAIYDDLTGSFLQVEGACIGDPHIKPGKPVELKSIGQRFSGKYYVTSCVHQYSGQGYITEFEANGRQTNSLLELTNQSGERSDGILGTVVGLVSNNKDPENKGRVKIKFPWLAENAESTWARIAAPMAGDGRGFFFLPEVNDEVLVAFEQGDIHRPYVLGVLWNGQDAPPKQNSAVVGSDGKVKERIIKTRSGHTVTFDDSDDAPKISIVDKTGNNKIIIDSTSNKITVESAQGDLELKASAGKITLDGREIEIKGAQSAKLTAVQVEVDGSGKTKINGGGMVEVSGGVIKLN